MAVDPTDLLRRLTARRQAIGAQTDPLGLLPDEAALRSGVPSPFPPAQFVPPGTPDGPAGGDILGLSGLDLSGLLPLDPGPRAPEGVMGGFGLNLPENPLPLGSQKARVQGDVQRLADDRARPGVLDVLARLSPNYQSIQESRKRVALADQSQRMTSLKTLIDAAEKMAENPEMGAAFKPLLQQAAKAAGIELDPETFDFVTETKGAATTLAIESDLVDVTPYLDAIRRVPKSQKASALKAMQDQVAAETQKVVGSRITTFLTQNPQIRVELAAAGEEAPAKILDLVTQGFPKEYDRQAALAWLGSEAGEKLMAGYGITSAGTMKKAADAAAVDAAKAKNNPAGLSIPRLAAIAAGTITDPNITPEQANAALDRLQLQGADLPTLALRASQGDQRAEAALTRYNQVAGQRAEATATGTARGAPLPVATQDILARAESLGVLIEQVKDARDRLPEIVGPIKGRVADVLSRWSQSHTLTDEQIAVQAAIASIQNQYVYMTTGKQINEAEAARLARVNPDINLPWNTFWARVDQFEREMNLIVRNRLKYATTPAGQLGTPGAVPPPASQSAGPQSAPGRSAPQAGPAVQEGAMLRRSDGTQWQFRGGQWQRLEDDD